MGAPTDGHYQGPPAARPISSTGGTSNNLKLGRDFRALIFAWAASLSGDGLRVVALPLLALLTNSSPAAVAGVAAAASAPWLLIAIPAGAIVDRLAPNRVIMVAHLVRGILTLGLVGTVITDSVSILLLCCFGFAITAAETFADGAAQSLLIEVVKPDQLERANARFVTVETLALDMVGPLTAGLLFLVSPWLPFVVSGVAFFGAAALISRVRRVPAANVGGKTGLDLRGRGRDLRDGLVFLFSHRVLRTLVLTVAVLAVANAAADGVLVLYAVSSLGLSESLFPTLLAAYSIGTLIAAAAVGKLAARFPDGALMAMAMVGMGSSMLVMGLIVSPIAAWISYAALGIFGGTWNVLSATRRQRHTPRAIIGRVSSAFRVIAWGVIPVGAALGGVIAEKVDVPMVFTIAGALTLLLAVIVGPILAGQRSPETSAPASGQRGAPADPPEPSPGVNRLLAMGHEGVTLPDPPQDPPSPHL